MAAAPKPFLRTLVGAFALSLLATLGTALLGAEFVRSLRADLNSVTVNAHRLAQIHELRFELERVVASSRGYLISEDDEQLRRAQVALQAARASLRTLPWPRDDRASPNARQVAYAGDAYLDVVQQALRSGEARGKAAADLFQEVLAPKRHELETAISALVRDEDARAAAQLERSERNASRALVLILGFGAIAVGLSGASAWFFGRWLTRSFMHEKAAVDRAERALAARDELLAIIAHDLRNPLNSILLNAALLREQNEASERGPSVAKPAASIEKAARRMEHLIKSLLEAATIEAGQFSVNIEPCRVADPIETSLEMFEPLADNKGIRLTAEVEPSQQERLVPMDRERIVQILSNLLGNALKVTAEGGTIRLRVGHDQRELRVSVTDSGPGIEAEHKPHLFTRYWKADKDRRRGAGLGLYIAKGIAHAHGGRIWVESTVGGGSTFTFSIPTDS